MEFKQFPKIARYSRDCVITEKIDGTNAQVCITEEGIMYVGSRTRWLWDTTQDQIHNDNHGFASFCAINKEELMKLGVGNHYGEWWGQGIQRKYNMDKKVFSLFNVHRWCEVGKELKQYPTNDPRVIKSQEYAPKCCSVVPLLNEGMFCDEIIETSISNLKSHGSYASEGFMNPEGIVIFHASRSYLFKKTIVGDEKPKSAGECKGSTSGS